MRQNQPVIAPRPCPRSRRALRYGELAPSGVQVHGGHFLPLSVRPSGRASLRACLLHRKLRLCGYGGVLGSFIGARDGMGWDGMGLFSAAVYFGYRFAVTAMGEVDRLG